MRRSRVLARQGCYPLELEVEAKHVFMHLVMASLVGTAHI